MSEFSDLVKKLNEIEANQKADTPVAKPSSERKNVMETRSLLKRMQELEERIVIVPTKKGMQDIDRSTFKDVEKMTKDRPKMSAPSMPKTPAPTKPMMPKTTPAPTKPMMPKNKMEAVGEFAEPIYDLMDEMGIESNDIMDNLIRYMSGDDIKDFVSNYRRMNDMQ